MKRILSNSNKVQKIECIKTNLVKKDGEDRLVPEDIQNSEFTMDMDFCVLAVGSKPEEKIVSNLGLEVTKWGYIIVDENYETSKKNVFAAGDIIGEKQTVAWAAKCGRDSAKKIIEKLI